MCVLVLNSTHGATDLDNFMAAMEAIILNVAKLPPEEVMANFSQVHKVFVRMTGLLLDMDMLDGAVRVQEAFVQFCEKNGVGEVHPDYYSFALNDLAETYYKLQKIGLAKRFYTQNIKFNEKLKRNGAATVSSLLDLQLAYGKLALIQAKETIEATSSFARIEGGNFDFGVSKLLALQQGIIAQLAERNDCKTTKKIISTVSAVNTLLELAHMCMNISRFEEGLVYFNKANEVATKFESLDEILKVEKALKEEKENENNVSSASNHIPSLRDTLDSIELGRTSFLTRMGRLDEAEASVKDLMKRQEGRIASDSPVMVATYNNLGHILAAKGNYAEAEKALLKAIEIVLNQSNQDQVDAYGERLYQMQALLGNVLKSQLKVSQAIEIQETNIKLSERLFGESAPQTIESIYNLSTSQIEMQQNSNALATIATAYVRAREGGIKASNPLLLSMARLYVMLLLGGNPRTFNIQLMDRQPYKPGAEVTAAQNAIDQKEAERVTLEVQNAVNHTYGTKSRQAANCYVIFGQIYEEIAHNLPKASEMYGSALTAFQSMPKSTGRDSAIASTQLALGRIMCEQRKMNEAKQNLEESLSSAKSLAQGFSSQFKAIKTNNNASNSDIANSKVLSQQAEHHFSVALQSYGALGQWAHLTNQLPKALSYTVEGIQYGTTYLGQDHFQTLNLGIQLAQLQIASGNISAASSTLNELTDIVSNSQKLSNAQKQLLTHKIQTKVSHHTKLASKTDNTTPNQQKQMRGKITPLK